MIKKLFYGALSLMALNSFSQAIPNIEWVEYYTERNQISNVPSAIDANNNAYITGYTFPFSQANQDATTVKYGPNGGAPLWVKNYDNGGMDNAKAIIVDASNVYITGESDGTGTGRDIFIVKYDALTGNQLFAFRWNGVANGHDVANAITLNPANGDIYVTGFTTNAGGTRDYVCIKLNNAGTQQFAVIFNGTGNLDDEATGIAFNNNRLYITGNATNMGGNTDMVTLRLNPNTGATLWTKTENGTANLNDNANAIVTDGNNVIVVGGVKNTGTGDDHITVKYNGATGSTLFNKQYDFGSTGNFATSVIVDATGGYAVTGIAFNGSVMEYHTLKYSATGTQQWVNKVSTGLTGYNSYPQIVTDPLVNHFYVCGQKSGVQSDILVYQITPGGNTAWQETFNGVQNSLDCAVDLVVNAQGVLYVAGMSLNSNAKFDYTTIKISQTPVYFPADPTGEIYSNNNLYYKNEGQLTDTSYAPVPNVLYYNHSTGPEFYIQKDRVSYVHRKNDTVAANKDTLQRIDVEFYKSNLLTKLYHFEPTYAGLNYFLPHCGVNGITGVQGNKRIMVPNIYPGTDLHYYSNANGMKYFFVVKPGYSPKDLILNIQGALSTTVSSGELLLNGKIGGVNLGSVKAYQVTLLNQVIPLTSQASWNAAGTNQYGFNIPSYNTALPLVIMVSKQVTPFSTGPIQNLNYSTYYGGSGDDVFNDIKVSDVTNKRYIAGTTKSSAFPAFQGAFLWGGGNSDAVLLSYTGGDTLICATFYGGTGNDSGVGVAVKSNGNVYLVGNTNSTNLPINASIRLAADQQTVNGYYSPSTTSQKDDGFILELSPKSLGFNHKWSRYFGGIIRDYIYDVAMDNKDNLYFVGQSNSCNYPKKFSLKSGPGQCQFGENYDMVITKMDSTCKLLFSTFYGGDNITQPCSVCAFQNNDAAVAVDADSLGYIYVAGATSFNTNDLSPVNLTGNTATTSIFNATMAGGGTVLLRFTPNNTLDFFSEIGRSATSIKDIKVLPNQNVLFVGGTQDSTAFFPLKQNGASYFRSVPLTTSYKGFISMVDSNLNNLWTTHFNRLAVYGSEEITVNRIAVATDNSFYVGGTSYYDSLTYASSTPPGVYTNPSHQSQDGWISYFSNAGGVQKLEHTHFLGGTTLDGINALDVYKKDALYATGFTYSSNYPVAFTTANANLIDNTYNGARDGFITRFDLSPLIISVKENSQTTSLSTIRSYPNPVQDQFFINASEIEAGKNLKIQAYNMAGQLIFENNYSNFNEELIKIDCNNWANGLYLISVRTDKNQFSGKVIKQ